MKLDLKLVLAFSVSTLALVLQLSFHIRARRLAALQLDNAIKEHPLSIEERRHFEAEGYLVLPNVLSSTEVETLTLAMDEWVAWQFQEVLEFQRWSTWEEWRRAPLGMA